MRQLKDWVFETFPRFIILAFIIEHLNSHFIHSVSPSFLNVCLPLLDAVRLSAPIAWKTYLQLLWHTKLLPQTLRSSDLKKSSTWVWRRSPPLSPSTPRTSPCLSKQISLHFHCFSSRGLYDPALGPNDFHQKCPTCFRSFEVRAFVQDRASRIVPDISVTSNWNCPSTTPSCSPPCSRSSSTSALTVTTSESAQRLLVASFSNSSSSTYAPLPCLDPLERWSHWRHEPRQRTECLWRQFDRDSRGGWCPYWSMFPLSSSTSQAVFDKYEAKLAATKHESKNEHMYVSNHFLIH